MRRAIAKYVPIFGMLLILITMPAFSGSAFGVASIASDKASDNAALKAPPFQLRIIQYGDLRAIAAPMYTTFDDPANHVVSSGGSLDGVGKIILTRSDGTFLCSGALLSTGLHVLTAAHCVTNSFGNFILNSATVTFEGDSGTETVTVDVANSAAHSRYNGNFLKGFDVAVLTLNSAPSSDITRYDIDRNSGDDVGSTPVKTGYGRSGTGDNGDTLPSGTKRTGQNLYDDVGDTMYLALGLKPNKDFVRGGVLQYDFDNGNSANDAFGFFFSNSDTGLGNDEVSSAPGDSGGPSQNGNVITGVTSYGITLSFTNGGGTSDVTVDEFGNPILDSSFGEFSGDSRVSKYTKFIDGITGASDDGGTDPGPGDKCNPGKQKKGLC